MKEAMCACAFRCAALSFALTGLAACGIMPADVKMPTAVQQRHHADDVAGPITGVYTLEAMDNQFAAFINVWDDESGTLFKEINGLDAFQFASLIWAAYKTSTGNLHDAKWGLAGAGGTQLLGANFKIFNQALGYRSGSEAMQCVKRTVDNFDESFWQTFYTNTGQLRFDDQEVVAYVSTGANDDERDKLAQGIAALRHNHTAIENAVAEIVKRVKHSLQATRVNMPTANDVNNAVTQSNQGTAKGQDNAATSLSTARPLAAANIEDFRQLKIARVAHIDTLDAASSNTMDAKTIQSSDARFHEAIQALKRRRSSDADLQAINSLESSHRQFVKRAADARKQGDVAPIDDKPFQNAFSAAAQQLTHTSDAVPLTLVNAISIQSKDKMAKAFSMATDLSACVALIPDNGQ